MIRSPQTLTGSVFNASTDGRNPLLVQLTHLPFPEVANTLRLAADDITVAWDAAVRRAMPQMAHLTFDEMKDSTPQILLAIAAALASEDPEEIRELVSKAPAQGLSRLRLHFDAIRHHAYGKWEVAGKPAGDGIGFWLEAEKELTTSDKGHWGQGNSQDADRHSEVRHPHSLKM